MKWKKSTITPIFKQGDREDIANYRPISILPYFSKLLEEAMYQHLYNYVSKMDILYTAQFGFRSGHSTAMALLNIRVVWKTMRKIKNSNLKDATFLCCEKWSNLVNNKVKYSFCKHLTPVHLKCLTKYKSMRFLSSVTSSLHVRCLVIACPIICNQYDLSPTYFCILQIIYKTVFTVKLSKSMWFTWLKKKTLKKRLKSFFCHWTLLFDIRHNQATSLISHNSCQTKSMIAQDWSF